MTKRHELERIYQGFNDISVPDPKFNPTHNSNVIAETVREATAYHQKEGKAISDTLGERIEAVASYGCYRFNRGTKSPEDYFGKAFTQKYVGERLLSKIKAAQSVNRLNGNSKYKNCILL